MEAFTYVNIFDTKGIEYVLVITFLLLVISFWRYLTR
jgi:glycine cleavage system H protein